MLAQRIRMLEKSAGVDRPVLFPREYPWLVLFASLDVMLTWLILAIGGIEVNPVAQHFIRWGGLWGMLVLKFGVLALVLLICEFIGRRREVTGRSLARAAVGLNCLPVSFACAQIALASLVG